MRFVVTGGRGFIGSHFVEASLEKGIKVIDIDKMGYASNISLPWDNDENYTFIQRDICDLKHLPPCDVIFNFAAESHVDNSITDPGLFVKSNFCGVQNLLELIRGKQKCDRPLFFHISTDEVYGDNLTGSFTEKDKLFPSNPYSATKAAAEMLILSYGRTYDIEYIISRSSNNYGPRQFEEKLIPKCLSYLEEETLIPVHGDGSYVRDWTYVKDNVDALFIILGEGESGGIYNVSAENTMTNLEVIDIVLEWTDKNRDCIKFVENRQGQDLRYSINSKKVKNLGWTPKHPRGLYKWF